LLPNNGQLVRLLFKVTEDNGLAGWFYIDNVGVTSTTQQSTIQ